MLIPDGHTSMSLWKLIWDPFRHAKDFGKTPEVNSNVEETQPGSYDGLGCAHKSPDVFTTFDNVLIITSEFWESMRPA